MTTYWPDWTYYPHGYRWWPVTTTYTYRIADPDLEAEVEELRAEVDRLRKKVKKLKKAR